MLRLDMGTTAEVTHITQREAELLGLSDGVDDLVPGRRLRVQYEHISGVKGPVYLDIGLPGKLLLRQYDQYPSIQQMGQVTIMSLW